MRNDFCAFILSHGRSDIIKTYSTLKKCGYTGKIIIVIDNEDLTINSYIDKFGRENVYIFNKQDLAEKSDSMDNFNNRKCILHARNACFEIAKELGIDYFIQLDDDYYWFGYRVDKKALTIRNLDELPEFVNDVNILTDFVQCMPDEYKVQSNAVQAYRKYYIAEKLVNALWKERQIPDIFVNHITFKEKLK